MRKLKTKRGFSLIELTVASAIVASTIAIFIRVAPIPLEQLKSTRFKYSLMELEDDIRRKSGEAASAYFLGLAQRSSPNVCKLQNSFTLLDSGGKTIVLQDSIQVLLLERGQSSSLSAIDRIDEQDATYSEAFQRCISTATAYPTELTNEQTGLPQIKTDYSSSSSLYFCVLLKANAAGTSSTVVRDHPALVEIMFNPTDVSAGTSYTCQDLSQGIAPTAMGVVQYTIYARSDSGSNHRISKQLSGQFVLGGLGS